MSTCITRRNALALGGLAAGGAGLAFATAGCKQTVQEDQPEHMDYTAQELDEKAAALLGSMTLEQKAAQMIVVTPEQLAGVDVALVAGERTDNALAEVPVGGLFYSGINMSGEDQIKSMVTNARVLSANAGAHVTAILTVSEEGGTIESPIALAAEIDSVPTRDAAELGETGDPSQAGEAALIIAEYIKELGFNVNFAPNANVLTNPDSPLGARIFSADTEVVTEMVAAEVEAYLDSNLPCVPKHFPGVGDATEHYTTGIPVTEMTVEQIREINLPPFQAAVDEGCPLMSMSALRTPAATGDDTPACASSFWATDVVRGEMGFEGVLFGARMDGDAIKSWMDQPQASIEIIKAGCDMVLLPEDPVLVRDGIVSAVGSGELTEERLDESLMRILKFKIEWGIQDY
jgi:beta-N-acetylhexosaminidase